MHYQIDYCENNPTAEYIILSSGLGGLAHFWKPQIKMLNEYFHVLSYDQEGCHPHSEQLALDYTMTNMAQQILEIIKKENIKKFHWIGHALGGHIGAELANLCVNETYGFLSFTAINMWDTLDAHTHKCFQARIQLLTHAGAEAYIQAQALFLYPPQWISDNIEELRRFEQHYLDDFPPSINVLTRIRALQKFELNLQHFQALSGVKVHIIANQDDFLVPVQKSIDLHHALGHGQLTLVEKGGHASTVVDAEKMNKVLLDFLI